MRSEDRLWRQSAAAACNPRLVPARGAGLDPLGLVSSGSLLIAIEPSRVGPLIAALRTVKVSAAPIGSFEKGKGVKAFRQDKAVRLKWFERDELLRLADGDGAVRHEKSAHRVRAQHQKSEEVK